MNQLLGNHSGNRSDDLLRLRPRENWDEIFEKHLLTGYVGRYFVGSRASRRAPIIQLARPGDLPPPLDAGRFWPTDSLRPAVERARWFASLDGGVAFVTSGRGMSDVLAIHLRLAGAEIAGMPVDEC